MLNPSDLLNLYKEETQKILKAVEDETIDVIDKMFDKRQEIINLLKNYNLKTYKKEFDEDIGPIEEKLRCVMEEKKQYFKKEFLKMRKQISVNKAYNNGVLNNMLNKKN